jgi:hypothetical protein
MADIDGQITQGQSRAGAKGRAQAIPVDMGLRNFLIGIYQKMALGLLITGGMAWAVAHSPFFVQMLYQRTPDGRVGYTLVGMLFAFAPLGLAFLANNAMQALNAKAMAATYWAFVAIMGVSLSSIFLLYANIDIASIFFVTAIAFGGLSLAGYTTKRDLSGWRGFLTMAIIGMIGASLLNMFFLKMALVQLAISIVGMVVFSALIAYRTQWLKGVYYQLENSYTGLAAMTYYGALSLYISFINLFLSLLRIFASGRR